MRELAKIFQIKISILSLFRENSVIHSIFLENGIDHVLKLNEIGVTSVVVTRNI